MRYLKRNLTLQSRLFRLCASVGMAVIAVYFSLSSILWQIITTIIVIILFTTATIGYCPIQTMSKQNEKGE